MVKNFLTSTAASLLLAVNPRPRRQWYYRVRSASPATAPRAGRSIR